MQNENKNLIYKVSVYIRRTRNQTGFGFPVQQIVEAKTHWSNVFRSLGENDFKLRIQYPKYQ